MNRSTLVHEPCGRRCAPAQDSGFTLLELLMTMAIAAILLTIGIPSFRYVTNSNRIAGEVNGLLGDLQFARSEAIKEGRSITVCVSNDQATCANSTTWNSGWIVWADVNNNNRVDGSEVLLRVQTPFTSTDTFNASNNVSTIIFNREGYATGIANGTVIALHDATNTSVWTRCLAVTLIGQMTTQLAGTTFNGLTCS